MARKTEHRQYIARLAQGGSGAAAQAAQRSRSFRPWAPCMTAILRWCAHAQKRAKRVVVSIFVNPTQFAPTEDFASYPRDLDRDLTALSRNLESIWSGRRTAPPCIRTASPPRIAPGGPAKAGLEDAFRPHFFGGVATVVAKLLLQVTPDFAMFGQKDYQQLKVVTRMAKDLDIPVDHRGLPTVREKDGLAMSSRNVYLSAPPNGRPRRCCIRC